MKLMDNFHVKAGYRGLIDTRKIKEQSIFLNIFMRAKIMRTFHELLVDRTLADRDPKTFKSVFRKTSDLFFYYNFLLYFYSFIFIFKFS